MVLLRLPVSSLSYGYSSEKKYRVVIVDVLSLLDFFANLILIALHSSNASALV